MTLQVYMTHDDMRNGEAVEFMFIKLFEADELARAKAFVVSPSYIEIFNFGRLIGDGHEIKISYNTEDFSFDEFYGIIVRNKGDRYD